MEFVVKVKIIMENGLEYTLVGDYFLPNLALPEEPRPIGKWGRLHREFLKTEHPIQFNALVLSGQLWTYLADLNEQAQERLPLIIERMKTPEGVTEELRVSNQMAWVGAMNSIATEPRKSSSGNWSTGKVTNYKKSRGGNKEFYLSPNGRTKPSPLARTSKTSWL